ncbi:hypothetical protein Tco_1253311 [Tanacetum coccineum]
MDVLIESVHVTNFVLSSSLVAPTTNNKRLLIIEGVFGTITNEVIQIATLETFSIILLLFVFLYFPEVLLFVMRLAVKLSSSSKDNFLNSLTPWRILIIVSEEVASSSLRTFLAFENNCNCHVHRSSYVLIVVVIALVTDGYIVSGGNYIGHNSMSETEFWKRSLLFRVINTAIIDS